jgi:hypothetical protein
VATKGRDSFIDATLHTIEAISKPQIRFEGKAKAEEKAQHTREYVSILKRLSTQPSSVRWVFEMASRHLF